MIIGKLESAALSAKLWFMMLRVRNPEPIYKTWGTIVLNKARANARAKGGRRLWKEISDSLRLKSVSARGANIEGVGLWGRIALHKEHGGAIRARERPWLTIPIHQLAYGKRVSEAASDLGVKLFRPKNTKVLAYSDGKKLVPLYALCKRTRSQRADPWKPEPQWILRQGLKEIERALKK